MRSSSYVPVAAHEFRASTEVPPTQVEAPSLIRRRSGPGTAFCFGVTLFVSAALLFLVQPMIGKMILPLLGGTPAVWNACMLFFQAALLGGYAYAHATTSRLGVKKQSILHLGILLLPLIGLPIGIGRGLTPPVEGSPVLWLLGCLCVSAGLPFFVVSTTGPLLQRWFADTDHPSAVDPFFLYAASNVGSLLALLAYPLVMEPLLVLTDQSQVWTYGYALLVMLIGACAVLVWRSGDAVKSPNAADLPSKLDHQSAAPITSGRRAWWVLASFVPSSLMLGVTAHVTSNLAPVPLLWVLPLAIYLLTFVLVFARSRPIPHVWMTCLLPFLMLPLAVMTFLELPNMAWIAVVVHFLGFFVAAMVCHGELANSRPSAKHLTEFYLWLSIGGVLGGVFNALLAPVLFDTIVEYPLSIMLACVFLPRQKGAGFSGVWTKRDVLFPLGYAAISAMILMLVWTCGWGESLGLRFIVFGILAVLCFSFKERPIRFALGMGVYMIAITSYSALHRGTQLYVTRNFFGVKRVVVDPKGSFRVLIHGNTTHGKQFIDPSRSTEPLTYYHRTGPLGDIFATVKNGGTHLNVAAVGLGTGSIASYIGLDDSVRIYEIDPEVEQIARDPKLFSFLEQCRGTWDVVIGDGRRSMEKEPNDHFEFILLDAFSSDSIPTHLLTREAIQLYLQKLTADGMLAFHISNRYLDLKPLLAALAADAGLYGLSRADVKTTKEETENGKTPAIYVVMTRHKDDAGDLVHDDKWKPLEVDPETPVWSDQYTSLLSFVHWR